MCQYRYYYYGGCQHQEVMLHDFCDRAAAVSDMKHHEEGTGTGPYQKTTSSPSPSPSPSQHSPAASFPSPHSSSSAPTSLTSLTSLAESPPHIPSIFQHPSGSQQPFSSGLSPDRQLRHAMPALAAFTAVGLRGMLASKPKQTVHPATPPASSPDNEYYTPVGQPQREQQSGSRRRDDGSWELLTGAEFSYGNDHIHSYEESPDANMSANEQSPTRIDDIGAYDTLADEIETLRDQVKQLRNSEFEVQKNTPKSSYSGKKTATTTSKSVGGGGRNRSKIPALSQPLQKLATVLPQPTHGARPSSHESKTSRKVSNHGKSGRKGPTAAHAAARGSKTTPESASHRAGRKDQSTSNASAIPYDGPSNGSPHFAQPTVAATIRHESVRKDSACQQGRVTLEGSTRKSIHTAVNRKRNRASLPGGWTESVGQEDSESSGLEPQFAAPVGDTLDLDSHAEYEDDREFAKKDQSLRKKTSATYMSPTKATTLRNIATISQENTKRTSPRISRSRPLSQIHTSLSPTDGILSSGSIVSDSGSEKIITKMQTKVAPARIALTNPTRYELPTNRSPTGIIPSELRRRMTVGGSVADALAQHARSCTFLGVAHTTRKRRETTGNLLNLIKARLNKVGLLNGSIYSNEPSVSSPLSTTIRSPLQGLAGTPEGAAEHDKSAVEPGKSTLETSKQAFQPSHRQTLATKAAQAASAAVIAAQPGYIDCQASPPVLRATAAEFTPMFKPLSPGSVPATPLNTVQDWDTALMFRSADQWASLSPDDKRRIQIARHFQRTGGEVPGAKMARQAHWQTIMLRHLATQPGPVPTYAEIQGTDIIAGQKPSLYPDSGTNGVQWTLHDTTDDETAMNFFGGSPSLVPRSFNDSSRRFHVSPPNSWSIGADASHQNTFGWTGGAGREIKFVGYGPDAERDPNTPVSFNFRGANSSSGRNEYGPRMVGPENYDGSPDPPLAPRSKTQWAKLKGYTHVPCSNVNITHGNEILPIPGFQNLAGYCNDCADSAH